MFSRSGKHYRKRAQLFWRSCVTGLAILCSVFFDIGAVSFFSEAANTVESVSEDPDGSTDAESDQNEALLGGGAAISGQVNGLGYATQLYDATNGLPTSDANAILATSDGFIWIGGYSGLIRYDGTNFERQGSSSGVTNVNALFEDHKRRLWVGTNDNGIVMLDGGTSRHWDYKEGISSSSVRTIAEDADGDILLGTTQGIDYIDGNGKLHSLDEPQLDNAYIKYMVADSEGRIYGHTRSGGAFCIEEKKVTAYYNGTDMGIGNITAIYPSPTESGQVYLGTSNGTFCQGSIQNNFNGMRTIDIVTKNLIINRIAYASGRVWLICGDTVGYLDEKNVFHALSNLPMDDSIGSLIEDYEGNLWFASDRQGVMKIVANKFANVTEAAGLESGVVNATCLHDGKLYIGTDSGLQIEADGDKITDDKLQSYLGDTRIRCIMEDAEKNLWISTYTNEKGLVCLKRSGEIISYTEEDGLLDNQTRGTSLASDGSVLVATNGGLNIIKDGKIVKSFGSESGISNTVILTAVEGENGAYYLGTDGDGIYVVDGNNVTRKGREDGLTSDIILRIKKDEKAGVYWIITSNSIEYLKDGELTEVSEFPYTNNYDIYFDENDNVWILSSYGVFVVRAQDMLANKKKFEYQVYDISGGLLSVPTGNAYSALDDEGNLYIAGRSGVCSVNIDNYFGQTHEIKLNVPYLEANGVRYYPNEKNEVKLPTSAKTVKIYGYALTYSMQNLELKYFLDGFDKEAATVSKKEMEPVRYTNLNGGKYTYELSVINTSTGEEQQTLKLTIIKAKAFYEQIWFYILVFILVAVCIAWIVRLYLHVKMKVFMKKEEEQKSLIREMVKAFAKTIDMKDKYTNGHSGRVADYTALLARELGYDEETVERYYNIALLHDIGKIGVPPEVLNKPGKLTDEEFRIIKSHSALGYNALKDISIMPELAIGAGAHHERPDGKGYPKGLKGDEIPRVAQIIAVADTFDAMYSNRPYRKRMNFEKAVSIIKEVSGTQLTADVVDAFLRLVEKGEFRAPDDHGGGTMEDINNIRKDFDAKGKSEA